MLSLFQIPPEPVRKDRSIESLTISALSVIDRSFAAGSGRMAPLFSGGHDSLCACHIAAQHPKFLGEVHKINTGIGAKENRIFTQDVCREFGWKLIEHQSNFSYEKFVRRLGFPGPGSHQWIYNKLKDRCVATIAKGSPVSLITGCRREESTRRMGNVEAVKVGETSKKTGVTTKKSRIWTAPCFDWSSGEQAAYMDHHDLPTSPLKKTLGMSGECFCGAFASPNEIERIRQHAPDVAAEIDRLTIIAADCGTHCEWGTRPKNRKGLVAVESGPLCSSCDRRAYAAGLLFN